MDVLNILKKGLIELTEIKTFKSFVKIAGRSVDVAKNIPEMKNNAALSEANKCLSFLSSVLSIHTGILSVGDFIKGAKKRSQLKGVEKVINDLEMVTNLCGMASGVTSSMKVVDTLHSWANSSATMGKTVLTSSTPFTQGTSLIQIIQVTIQIGIGILKLYNLEKKVDKVKDKVTFWQGDIDDIFIKNRIKHIEDKQEALILKIAAAEEKALKSTEKKDSSAQNLNDKKTSLNNKKGIKKAFAWVAYKNCKHSHHSLTVRQTKHQQAADLLNQKHADNATKIQNWTSIANKLDHLTDEETNALDQFKRNKQTKWRIKQSNLRLNQWKTSLGLALKTALLITLIASFVLTTTGTGTVPGLLTLATISLFLSVSGLGLDWYIKYRKPRKVHSVKVPILPNISTATP